MAKLYFRYGTVSSAKSLNLLAVVHNYESQGKKALLLKPEIDTRFGMEHVRSRAGLERKADIILGIDAHKNFDYSILEGVQCLVVDEAQFLTEETIEMFRAITLKDHIPVICYGLRTDFKSKFFPGVKTLDGIV